MQPDKSTAAGKSDGAARAEQIAADSKGVAPCRRINVEMAQNLLLIWLDKNIDDNSVDYQNIVTELRRVVNTVKTFTNADKCVNFLTNIFQDSVCIIISGTLCRNVVPLIHDVAQLHTIFIFSENKTGHEQWAEDWPKVKGMFTEISSICEALKQATLQCEQNAIPISFIATSGDISKKNLHQLDPSFMYTQIIKEILLKIDFEEIHFTGYIDYCRDVLAKNPAQLKNVDKLQAEYRDETPIWWYTFECFLYFMLNQALRLMNVDRIIKMGFFIGDLHQHIDQLHKEQFGSQQNSKTFMVYRGQGMSETEFEQMSKTKGGLLSFNSFLSTSKDRAVAFARAESNSYNPDLLGIFFVMTIDPSKSTTPFASIIDVSYYKDKEDEVLFAMQTVFRINDIKLMGGNHRLFQVDLTLTRDNDKDLRILTDCIRQETHPELEGWHRLGSVLLKMGEAAKAEEVYKILLEQATDGDRKAPVYQQIGLAKNIQGEYNEAFRFFEKSLEIYKKTHPPNHPIFASSYINIGNMFFHTAEYSKALSYYEKAFEIQQQSLSPNHPDFANSYGNIGNVYCIMGEYSKGLSYYEKSLESHKRTLPPNHPHLGNCYNNIGLVYRNMGEYSKALSYYEKAVEIQRQSLLSNHPDLGNSYNNIGLVYENMGEYSKALSYHKKALETKQQLLRPNHPDLAPSYNNISNVYSKMGEYSKALSFHQMALEIEQQSLPPNHPDFTSSYNDMGNVYCIMGEYSKALSYHKKALEIDEKTYHSNHPHLAYSYGNMGNVYSETGEYSKALSYYEKAVEIQQQSLPPNHPDFASSYGNMGSVYKTMGEYSKAFSYYEKSFEIHKKTLPPNHPDLASSHSNIGSVYFQMGEYSKALSYYEKALEIQQQSLPPNHPDFAKSYNTIGNLYCTMGEHSEALSYHKKALKIQKKHFLRIILIWLLPTATSVACIPKWVNIRKHSPVTKKHLKFNNNHFLRTILILLSHTITSVMCIAQWVNIRKRSRTTKKRLKSKKKHFL
jgi:tetratricopeptide (TPR) repeat protein